MDTIKRVSLSNQVLDSIVKYTQENKLQVGDKLPTESEFATQFRVSRNIVREAMKALAMNGAVESIPGKGTFMRQPMLNFTLNEGTNLEFHADVSAQQIMEVFTDLDVLAVKLCIDRASEKDLVKIDDTLHDLREALLSKKAWAEQGAAFHVRIAECARNPLLVKMVGNCADVIGRCCDAMIPSDTEGSRTHHIQEHEDILNAIHAREREAAEAAVRILMKSMEKELRGLMNINSVIDFDYKSK